MGHRVTAAQPVDPLAITTYIEGNDEIVHPSVVDAGVSGWNGYRYWMAATPYPNSDDLFENPSIWASEDGSTWVIPAGATNPVVAPPASGYWSDPHIVLDSGTMYLYYRGVGTPAPLSPNEGILVRSSTDGVTWSAPSVSVSLDPFVTRCLAPAIINDGGTWRMWFVDIVPSPYVVRMYTASSPTGTFTAAAACLLPPPNGKQLWHLDVQLRDGTFWMLMNVTDPSSSGGGQVYVADSTDGITWNRRPYPLLSTRGLEWDASIYRSCWVATDVGWDVWYSSASPLWMIGRTSVDVHPIP